MIVPSPRTSVDSSTLFWQPPTKSDGKPLASILRAPYIPRNALQDPLSNLRELSTSPPHHVHFPDEMDISDTDTMYSIESPSPATPCSSPVAPVAPEITPVPADQSQATPAESIGLYSPWPLSWTTAFPVGAAIPGLGIYRGIRERWSDTSAIIQYTVIELRVQTTTNANGRRRSRAQEFVRDMEARVHLCDFEDVDTAIPGPLPSPKLMSFFEFDDDGDDMENKSSSFFSSFYKVFCCVGRT